MSNLPPALVQGQFATTDHPSLMTLMSKTSRELQANDLLSVRKLLYSTIGAPWTNLAMRFITLDPKEEKVLQSWGRRQTALWATYLAYGAPKGRPGPTDFSTLPTPMGPPA